MKRKMIYKIFCAVSLCVVGISNAFAAPTTTQLEAARDKSLAYLIQEQNGDGSWGDTPDEKVRITATMLDVFKQYNVTGLVYRRGLNWLANAETSSSDALARQIIALSAVGLDVSQYTNQLIAQGTTVDEGLIWGALEDYRYSAIDTALALRALDVGMPSYDLGPAMTYVYKNRNKHAPTNALTSAWGFSEKTHNQRSLSNVLSSAHMLLLLHQLGGINWGQSADKSAAHWVALQKHSSGAIADGDEQADVETAMAVQALGFAKDVSTGSASADINAAYDSGLDYLLSRQNTNGSLDDNLYKTAVAAQAWFNQDQALTDLDHDGIPDAVEIVLGTDPNVIDTDYLETGNGHHYADTSGGFYFSEILVNQTTVLQLDTTPGTMTLSSGELPSGMSINSSSGTLTGTPTVAGSYSFAYQITQADGADYLGAALIRVVEADSDTDNDGIPASFEVTYSGILSNLNSNDAWVDSDGDGLSNHQEYTYNANPTLADTDGDGLDDFEEVFLAGSNPNLSDTDFDGIPDHYEYLNGLDPNSDDAHQDLDGDGLSNYDEYLLGLPANNPDFDGDGVLDGMDDDPFFNPAWLIPIFYLLLN